MIVRPLTARPPARRGITVVEMALLLTIFLMFLFGIFEYARYIMMLQIATNAARDGARYASVNVAQAGNFDAVDSTQVDSEGNPLVSIQKFTKQKMGGIDRMISGFSVEVFPCDSTQLYKDPPNITPKAGWTNNPNSRTTDWNDAQFGERIAVRISGTYQPILPTFLWMQNTTNVKIAALMGSEG
jgi:Flp pilus assembly protein TadG